MGQRREDKARLRVLVPSGPEMIRMYHRNIIANLRALKTPQVRVPSIVTRAKIIVRESREFVVRETPAED